MMFIETVTPLLYTLGRLGLEEQADRLMLLNIMSGTTKRSRLTVFAAALFHTTIMCAFFQTLYYPSTFPPVQWDSSSHTVLTSEVYQRRCIDCLFYLVCICLGFMIGQVSCNTLAVECAYLFVGSIIMMMFVWVKHICRPLAACTQWSISLSKYQVIVFLD